MTTMQVTPEQIVSLKAIDEGLTASLWTRVPGKERLYIELSSLNRWYGSTGIRICVHLSDGHVTTGSWAGSRTRDYYDEHQALEKIGAVLGVKMPAARDINTRGSMTTKKQVGRFEIRVGRGILHGFVMTHRPERAHHADRRFAVWLRPDGHISLGEGWRSVLGSDDAVDLRRLITAALKWHATAGQQAAEEAS